MAKDVSSAPQRQRFVAMVKGVCLAIPFAPDATLGEFCHEVSHRIESHRRLRNDTSLAKRIESGFIKLQTPHLGQLIDCTGSDKLSEIATKEDVIVFHTQSDDEHEMSPKIEVVASSPAKTGSPRSKRTVPPKSPKKGKKGAENVSYAPNLRPKSLKSAPKGGADASSGKGSKNKSSNAGSSKGKGRATPKAAKSGVDAKKRHSFQKPLKPPTPKSGKMRPNSARVGNNQKTGIISKKAVGNEKDRALETSKTDLTNPPSLSNSPEAGALFATNSGGKEKELHRTKSALVAPMNKMSKMNIIEETVAMERNEIPRKSASSVVSVESSVASPMTDLAVLNDYDSNNLNETYDLENDDNDDNDDNASNESASVLIHSDSDDDDMDDTESTPGDGLTPMTPSRSEPLSREGQASQSHSVIKRNSFGKTNQRKDMTSNSIYRVRGGAVPARVGAHKRNKSTHQRSISLTNSAQFLEKMGSVTNVNVRNKIKTKGKDKETNVYEMNAKDRSADRSKRRNNAFNAYFDNLNGNEKSSKKKKKSGMDDSSKRKTQFRYGNRNINIINPTLLPDEEELAQLPQKYLELTYVHGYNGYDSNFGRQNMMISHDETELVYPQSKLGILFNYKTNSQRFFNEATEMITSITMHSTAPIIACGLRQHGPDRAKILIWNYKTLQLHKIIKKAHDAAVIAMQFSRVSNYCYSIGGDEHHLLKIWDNHTLYKLQTSTNSQTNEVTYIDHEDVVSSDPMSKSSNWVNSEIEIVSDLLIGKSDILGFELNPYISEHDRNVNGVIDEFITFGKKYCKYWQVKVRKEKRINKTKEMVLPLGKALVMNANKLGTKSNAYEKAYHCCQWLPEPYHGWYILGSHSGTIYICYKFIFVKKFTFLHTNDSLIACMTLVHNVDNNAASNNNSNNNSVATPSTKTNKFTIFSAGWDGSLTQFKVTLSKRDKSGATPTGGSGGANLFPDTTTINNKNEEDKGTSPDESAMDPNMYVPKVKKLGVKIVRIPRSLDKKAASAEEKEEDENSVAEASQLNLDHLQKMQPRAMAYGRGENCMFIGLRSNQVVKVRCDFDSNESKDGKDTKDAADETSQNKDDVPGVKLLIDSHIGTVTCVASHPYENYFITGSTDHTLRIWSVLDYECIETFKFDERETPSCLQFNHSGTIVAVGLMSSQFILLSWQTNEVSKILNLNILTITQMPFKIDKSLKKSEQKARNSQFSTEITCIKWNKDDNILAVGHVDALAHIFTLSFEYLDDAPNATNEESNSLVVHVKAWESSLDVSSGVRDMQWSEDTKWLVTFDFSCDIMIWFIDTKDESFEHYLYLLDPNLVKFIDDPLMAAWDTQGLFQSYMGWDQNDLKSLSLTKNFYEKTTPLMEMDCNKKIGQKPQTKCKLIATGDNKGFLRVHNYPSINETAHHYYFGHSSQVTGVAWTYDDKYLISIGGTDKSIFEWKLTDEKTHYIKKYRPLKSKNPFKK